MTTTTFPNVSFDSRRWWALADFRYRENAIDVGLENAASEQGNDLGGEKTGWQRFFLPSERARRTVPRIWRRLLMTYLASSS